MGVDLFVVGGAVGAFWGGPVGWAAFVHCPRTSETHKIVDGEPRAVVDEADLKPFAAAIQWWHNKYNSSGIIEVPRVLCVTDAPAVVAAGKTPELRDSSRSDWRFIDWFERRGYRIEWHWESRERHPGVIAEAEAVRERLRLDATAATATATP